MDEARKWTDGQLETLERRMQREYYQAEREMRGKLAKSLEKFERERTQRERALDDTAEAIERHNEWLRMQAAQHTRMGSIAEQYADAAHSANRRAADMVNDMLPHVYAENANMAAFAIDKAVKADTAFTLVNEDAVRYLMGIRTEGADPTQLIRETVWFMPQEGREHIQDVRKRAIDAAKDIRWNRQKFTSAITQGILQGESIPNITRRMRDVFGANREAATRAARTACTNAENAGRMSSFERAERLGIDLEIEWLATLDGRTRSSHRALDGERIHTGEKFSNGLRWPGDPLGPGSEVWNCRCRANGRVVGFDGKRGDWADDATGERWARLPRGMTYGEWKAAKAVSSAESYLNDAGRVSTDIFGNSVSEAVTIAENVNSAGYAIDDLHPESINGVRRTSEAMSFDDANELRGNPRYEIDKDVNARYEAIKAEKREAHYAWFDGNISEAEYIEVENRFYAVRDEYERAMQAREPYTVNCQTCVVANEARRRGYDVMATGNVRGSVNERVSRKTNLAWIDPATGKNPEYIRYDGPGSKDFRDRAIPTRTSYWKWLDSDGVIEEGNRYTIEFSWKGRSRMGHIVNLERVEGELRLYDPQNGSVLRGDEVKEYLGDVKYSRTSYGTKYADGPEILRVDNMIFNGDVVEQILEAGA